MRDLCCCPKFPLTSAWPQNGRDVYSFINVATNGRGYGGNFSVSLEMPYLFVFVC